MNSSPETTCFLALPYSKLPSGLTLHFATLVCSTQCSQGVDYTAEGPSSALPQVLEWWPQLVSSCNSLPGSTAHMPKAKEASSPLDLQAEDYTCRVPWTSIVCQLVLLATAAEANHILLLGNWNWILVPYPLLLRERNTSFYWSFATCSLLPSRYHTDDE